MRIAIAVLLGASVIAPQVAPGAAPQVAPGAAASTPGPRVAVYLTTKDLKTTLARQRDLTFTPASPSGNVTDTIAVDPSTTYQRLTAGFGVAMTDTSAYVLDKELPDSASDQAMRLLFSRTRGIGLSFLRVPIAGSDYIVGGKAYSYDDQPAGKSDPTLADFSIAHDQPYILPMIHEALALNPQISIMANPWTPPAWMKSDDSLVTRTGPLGTLLPQYYGAYANYLVKFLEVYRAAGVPVQYLGVQNEPLTPLLFVAGIPESYLSPQDEGSLIHSYVAPALRAAGLTPSILAYDDGFQRSEAYIPAVMALAGTDVEGLAYHCYLSDPSSMSIEHQRYPSEPAFETECSSNLSNIAPAQMAVRSLRNWAQGIQLWNAALDQHLGPKIGSGCAGIPGTGPNAGKDCIAPVIVDTAKHTFSLTSDYWALAQFSRFIRLGAVRIGSTTPSSCADSPAPPSPCGVEDVAFRNPDGSQALVATTNDGNPHTVEVTENGESFSYTIPDGAIVTFTWPAPTPAISGLRVQHGAARFNLTEDAAVSVVLERRRRNGTYARVERLAVLALAGSDSVPLGGPARAAGSYRVTLTATDAAGNRSTPARAAFRIRAR